MAYVELAEKVGQGNQSFLVIDRYEETGPYGFYSLDLMCQFEASAASGWRFKRWEARSRHTIDDTNPGSGMSGWSTWSLASTSETFTRQLHVYAHRDPIPDVSWGSYTYDYTYEHQFRAVFEQDSSPGQTYTVTVVADPLAGGTVWGGGQYQAGSTCTITATPNSGYYFVKWEPSDGEVTIENPHPFTVTKNITWTAKFHLCTNLLLHGSSDTLLHGSSGTLLHDS